MKINRNILTPFVGAVLLALVAACSGQKEKPADEEKKDSTENAAGASEEHASAPQFSVDAAFQQQLADVFTAYVGVKDALVASDAAKTKTEATAAAGALAKVDMKLVTGPAHHDWMSYLPALETSLKEISGSSDLVVQRKAFSTLSDNLYKTVKAYGLGDKAAFYEFCPMAFNNEGGYWLSDQEQIRNPYFGDEMLTCGMVKEKL